MPNFNSEDTPECKAEVRKYYKIVVDRVKETKADNLRLSASYQEILDRQLRYGVEIVNNKKFLDWTISDWASSTKL